MVVKERGPKKASATDSATIGRLAGGIRTSQAEALMPPPPARNRSSSSVAMKSMSRPLRFATSPSIARCHGDEGPLQLFRRWYCSDYYHEKVLQSLGSKLKIIAVNGNSTETAPLEYFPLDRLHESTRESLRLKIAAEALQRALELAGSHPQDEIAQQAIPELVEVAQAAIPFASDVPCSVKSSSGNTSDYKPYFSEYDLRSRLELVRRIQVLVRVREIGQRVVDGIATPEALRLVLMSHGAKGRRKVRVSAVDGAAVIPADRSALSSLCQRVVGSCIKQTVKLLDDLAPPQQSSWGLVLQRHIPPFKLLAVLFVDVDNSRKSILSKALVRRELLGLPPFLRSIKRLAGQAPNSETSTRQGTVGDSGPTSSAVSLFPSVFELDAQFFDVHRHISKDFSVIDDEIAVEVCDGGSLQFVCVAGDVDRVAATLWDEVLSATYCDKMDGGTPLRGIWSVVEHIAVSPSSPSVATATVEGVSVAATWFPGTLKVSSDTPPLLGMIFGVLMEERRRGSEPKICDIYFCGVIELSR